MLPAARHGRHLRGRHRRPARQGPAHRTAGRAHRRRVRARRSSGRAFGVHRALDTLGAALGPLVAFALLLAVPRGYDAIFVASFAFAVVGVAVMVLFVPDLPDGGRGPARGRAGSSGLLAERSAEPAARATAAAGRRAARRVHRRRRVPLPVAAAPRRLRHPALPAAVRRHQHRLPACWPSRWAGSPTASAGPRCWSAATSRCSPATCSRPLPFGGPAVDVIVLLLLGTFYAATDGVLPALVSQPAADRVRGSGIAAAQTVVVVARLLSSLGFGVLWASHVAGLRAAAPSPSCWPARSRSAGWLLRGASPAPLVPDDACGSGSPSSARCCCSRSPAPVGYVLTCAASARPTPAAPRPRCRSGTDLAAVQKAPHLVFRNTALGDRLRPGGDGAARRPGRARAIIAGRLRPGLRAHVEAVCLVVKRGTGHHVPGPGARRAVDARAHAPLPGLPSRARISPDGIAAGHDHVRLRRLVHQPRPVLHPYASCPSWPAAADRDLEQFTLVVDGKMITAADKNIWGVTFADDDTVLRHRRLGQEDLAGAGLAVPAADDRAARGRRVPVAVAGRHPDRVQEARRPAQRAVAAGRVRPGQPRRRR